MVLSAHLPSSDRTVKKQDPMANPTPSLSLPEIYVTINFFF
jgi:hypothetical protein